jgi:hypothetical protein
MSDKVGKDVHLYVQYHRVSQHITGFSTDAQSTDLFPSDSPNPSLQALVGKSRWLSISIRFKLPSVFNWHSIQIPISLLRTSRKSETT